MNRVDRVARAQVVAAHLADVLERRVSGESAGAAADRLDLVERGLGTLAAAWHVDVLPRTVRRPATDELERALADARATAAVLVLARQSAGTERVEQIRDLEGRTALFRHLHAALREQDAARSADPVVAVVRPPRAAEGVFRRLVGERVVANQRHALRASGRSIELILTGRSPIIVPTLAEEARFRGELREHDLVERGFSELVPRVWSVRPVPHGKVGLVAEARALVELRAAAASVAVLLQQPETPDDPDLLAIAEALFRHLEIELTRFGFEDAELLPGSRAQLDRIVAFALAGQRWGSL